MNLPQELDAGLGGVGHREGISTRADVDNVELLRGVLAKLGDLDADEAAAMVAIDGEDVLHAGQQGLGGGELGEECRVLLPGFARDLTAVRRAVACDAATCGQGAAAERIVGLSLAGSWSGRGEASGGEAGEKKWGDEAHGGVRVME